MATNKLSNKKAPNFPFMSGVSPNGIRNSQPSFDTDDNDPNDNDNDAEDLAEMRKPTSTVKKVVKKKVTAKPKATASKKTVVKKTVSKGAKKK